MPDALINEINSSSRAICFPHSTIFHDCHVKFIAGDSYSCQATTYGNVSVGVFLFKLYACDVWNSI